MIEINQLKANEVYLEYGKVAESIQVFELELGNIIISHSILLNNVNLMDITDTDKKDFTNLVDRLNKKTLGQIIKDLKNKINFDESILGEIDEVLEKRNYLIHHFFPTHNIRINSKEGRGIMIAELISINEIIHVAYNKCLVLSKIMDDLAGLSGMNDKYKKRIDEAFESGTSLDLL